MPKQFKAWDTKEKKWIEEFFVSSNGKIVPYEYAEHHMFVEDTYNKNTIRIDFTGLFDDKGVPLYSKDAVEFWDTAQGENKVYSILENDPESLIRFKYRTKLWNHHGFIGSSLDHPELIK